MAKPKDPPRTHVENVVWNAALKGNPVTFERIENGSRTQDEMDRALELADQLGVDVHVE